MSAVYKMEICGNLLVPAGALPGWEQCVTSTSSPARERRVCHQAVGSVSPEKEYREECVTRQGAVCHLFGPRMTTSRSIFFTAESFGLWDPQLWSQEGLEPFGELLGASGSYRGFPRSPPHGNP